MSIETPGWSVLRQLLATASFLPSLKWRTIISAITGSVLVWALLWGHIMSFLRGGDSSEICEESETGRKFEKVERPCGSAPCPFSVFLHLSIPYFSTMIWLHRSVWPPPHRSCLSHPFCPCHTVALCRWWWVLKPATSTAWRTHKRHLFSPRQENVL